MHLPIGNNHSLHKKNSFHHSRWRELIISSHPSAGIIRIRFAGRGLMGLLSAWYYLAPRASHVLLMMSINCFRKLSSCDFMVDCVRRMEGGDRFAA